LRERNLQSIGYDGDIEDSYTMNMWLHKRVLKKVEENGADLEWGPILIKYGSPCAYAPCSCCWYPRGSKPLAGLVYVMRYEKGPDESKLR